MVDRFSSLARYRVGRRALIQPQTVTRFGPATALDGNRLSVFRPETLRAIQGRQLFGDRLPVGTQPLSRRSQLVPLRAETFFTPEPATEIESLVSADDGLLPEAAPSVEVPPPPEERQEPQPRSDLPAASPLIADRHLPSSEPAASSDPTIAANSSDAGESGQRSTSTDMFSAVELIAASDLPLPVPPPVPEPPAEMGQKSTLLPRSATELQPELPPPVIAPVEPEPPNNQPADLSADFPAAISNLPAPARSPFVSPRPPLATTPETDSPGTEPSRTDPLETDAPTAGPRQVDRSATVQPSMQSLPVASEQSVPAAASDDLRRPQQLLTTVSTGAATAPKAPAIADSEVPAVSPLVAQSPEQRGFPATEPVTAQPPFTSSSPPSSPANLPGVTESARSPRMRDLWPETETVSSDRQPAIALPPPELTNPAAAAVNMSPTENSTTIKITIGRIDIRATPPPPPPSRPRRSTSRPALSLSDYLDRRHRT